MADESLLTIWQEIRGRTLRLVDVSPHDALQQVAGTSNHILWHAGHILCVCDRLVLGAVQQTTAVPETLPVGWWDLFGWGSDPQLTADESWPELGRVQAALQEQQGRMQQLFATLTPEQLAAALHLPEWGMKGRPVRQAILHALHDEALHGGEIWLLRKLMQSRAK